MKPSDKRNWPDYRAFGYANEEEYLRHHPLDENESPMHEEIDLDEEDEAALDRAWARVMAHKRPARLGEVGKPEVHAQPTEATEPNNDDGGTSDN